MNCLLLLVTEVVIAESTQQQKSLQGSTVQGFVQKLSYLLQTLDAYIAVPNIVAMVLQGNAAFFVSAKAGHF